MKDRYKKCKSRFIQGSVTVFVTMILVPCVFFTGFIVDLARLKLFSNQAVMAADTYGAAALAEYDGYLYTLYGLFAITQDGEIDIEATSEEILKTFNDGGSSKDAFMPYANAQDMDLSLKMIEQSAMSNSDILETQIADYMKYRIIENFVEATDGGVLDAVEMMEHVKENLDAAKAMEKFSKTCANTDNEYEEYYKTFSYVGNDNGKSDFDNDIDDLNNKVGEYNDALSAWNSIKDASSDDPDEQAEIAAAKAEARARLDNAINSVNDKKSAIISSLDSFETNCQRQEKKISEAIDATNAEIEETKAIVEADGVNEEFKAQAIQDIDKITFISIEDINSLTNRAITSCESAKNSLNTINVDGSSAAGTVVIGLSDAISTESTYQKLSECYSADEKAARKAKKLKNQYEEQSQSKVDELNEDEETTARDIPAKYQSAAGGGTGVVVIDNLFSILSSMFSGSSLGTILVDDYYLVEYDFGMFTSRITEEKEEKESLVGYEFSSDVNYSYLAEIEYLIAGNAGDGSAKSNLNYVRNIIVAFRMLMNYISTYTCSAVNNSINGATATLAIAPLAAFALNQAARIGIAAYESYEDWNKLKSGESTLLIKTAFSDFSPDTIGNFGLSEGETSSSVKIELDYEQYCEVLLFFFTNRDQRIQRTANLIELNVNHASGKDYFSMENAYTAVDATFKCRLPFAVMPKGFARQVTPDNYGAIQQFERNYYTYTVTRGY